MEKEKRTQEDANEEPVERFWMVETQKPDSLSVNWYTKVRGLTGEQAERHAIEIANKNPEWGVAICQTDKRGGKDMESRRILKYPKKDE